MSTMSLRLPESLHQQAKMLAEQEGVSINQLVATALAEKISALQALRYLEERATRGSRQKYEKVLGKVKDTSPTLGDEL
jgi:post-segregation antitoxin (ccd killing protein)